MKLDPATYNLVINSYANDKDYEGARQWLQVRVRMSTRR